ncbi:MAG: sigma-70 family RNA polymerase sigma factor [Armatimonadota bacterium]
MLKCQEDDCDAFDEIVARYKDSIYNYIWRMISNQDDVEDLTQEVFLKAFASIKKFRSESNLRTWLYKIATNICIDKYRRAGFEKKILTPMEREMDDGEEPETIDLPDSTYDPRLLYERQELQSEVQKALIRLPEKLRAVILLYDMEDMSYEEIAEALNCPMGTVKSRLHKARMHLRQLLRSYIENK